MGIFDERSISAGRRCCSLDQTPRPRTRCRHTSAGAATWISRSGGGTRSNIGGHRGRLGALDGRGEDLHSAVDETLVQDRAPPRTSHAPGRTDGPRPCGTTSREPDAAGSLTRPGDGVGCEKPATPGCGVAVRSGPSVPPSRDGTLPIMRRAVPLSGEGASVRPSRVRAANGPSGFHRRVGGELGDPAGLLHLGHHGGLAGTGGAGQLDASSPPPPVVGLTPGAGAS